MQAIFKQRGDAIDYTPMSDVAAGDVVVLGDLVGVAKLDIKAGELGALAVTGVFEMPKATGTGTAITAGQKLYWLAANSVVTTDADDGESTSYPYLGKAVASTSDDSPTVLVRLSQ